MNGNYPPWHQPSHSTEIEHRLTQVESQQGHNREVNEERYEELLESAEELDEKYEKKTEALSKRLSLHEKAILVLAGALQILAQEKYPQLGKIIRGMLIP
jgi:predicted nucleotide-binding protein (sugar kinase/HSP70/actin superfamily)